MEDKYMKKALKEAKKAFNNGDVPIGCIIVWTPSIKKNINKNTNKMFLKMEALGFKEGDVIAAAYNKRNKNKLATAHAEILAINKACKKIQDFRLDYCTMYVTLEPCQMCAGAITQARIAKVVIGVKSKKSGSCGSIINILENNEFNHKVEIEYSSMEEECANLLKEFFMELRGNIKVQS